MHFRFIAIMAVWAALAACTDVPAVGSVPKTSFSKTTVSIPHGLDSALIARGRELYQANCTVCHRANGEGDPNWHHRGSHGKFLPPPLNESGHAWHHDRQSLVRTITQGTVASGGNMPAWGDKFPAADIDALMAAIQSFWSEEAYSAWHRLA
jgi:mono/diheme cytochrome c family protein